MSVLRFTLVGHFDPRRIHLRDFSVSRPLDKERLDELLAELPPEARGLVRPEGGHVHCQWMPAGGAELSHALHRFAYRLAEVEGCVFVESGWRVTYPKEAERAQQQEWQSEGTA